MKTESLEHCNIASKHLVSTPLWLKANKWLPHVLPLGVLIAKESTKALHMNIVQDSEKILKFSFKKNIDHSEAIS